MSSKTLQFPEFFMHDGEFWKIPAPIRLGSQDSIIRKIAADLPINMLSAFLLPGGRAANIQTKGESIIIWTELDSLNISTVYTVARDGSRYPVFKKPERMSSPPEHEASFPWNPSVIGMRLFFTSTLIFNLVTKLYDWKVSFLIAKAPKRKEIFRVPIPNTYADAKLCMGNDYHHSGPCLADVFCHNLAHLDDSKWNSDLSEGISPDHIKAMFTFDKDNKQAAPPKDYKWWENPATNQVNNMNYGELPLV